MDNGDQLAAMADLRTRLDRLIAVQELGTEEMRHVVAAVEALADSMYASSDEGRAIVLTEIRSTEPHSIEERQGGLGRTLG